MKLMSKQLINMHKDSDQGFSLIETTIALTTLGVCLAYAMPLFLYAKVNNSKSEIRTGALIVSQRIFDDIRSQPFKNADGTPFIPLTDGQTRDGGASASVQKTKWITSADDSWKMVGKNDDGKNPVVVPPILPPTDPTTAEAKRNKLLTYAMGRQYRTKVTYCENYDADKTVCSDNYRKFKVEVSFNGAKVYDLEGTYTNFDK